MGAEMIIAFGILVLKYGVPTAIDLVKVWKDKGPITLERIEELKNIKSPEEYFG